MKVLLFLSCSKKNNQCEICSFWEKRKDKLEKLLANEDYKDELKDIIKKSLENMDNFKGL